LNDLQRNCRVGPLIRTAVLAKPMNGMHPEPLAAVTAITSSPRTVVRSQSPNAARRKGSRRSSALGSRSFARPF
jgi:hypothetical protein